MSINFYCEDVKSLPLARVNLRNWISSVIREENKATGNLNFIFCSDDYLLRINQEFLQHDFYTDIITFDYVEGQVVSGDIFISVERVKENAHAFKVSFQNELNRVIIHGVLHLLGYQDKKIEYKDEMTKKEDYYLLKMQELE